MVQSSERRVISSARAEDSTIIRTMRRNHVQHAKDKPKRSWRCQEAHVQRKVKKMGFEAHGEFHHEEGRMVYRNQKKGKDRNTMCKLCENEERMPIWARTRESTRESNQEGWMAWVKETEQSKFKVLHGYETKAKA